MGRGGERPTQSCKNPSILVGLNSTRCIPILYSYPHQPNNLFQLKFCSTFIKPKQTLPNSQKCLLNIPEDNIVQLLEGKEKKRFRNMKKKNMNLPNEWCQKCITHSIHSKHMCNVNSHFKPLFYLCRDRFFSIGVPQILQLPW